LVAGAVVGLAVAYWWAGRVWRLWVLRRAARRMWPVGPGSACAPTSLELRDGWVFIGPLGTSAPSADQCAQQGDSGWG
jgi:hypothetical protein